MNSFRLLRPEEVLYQWDELAAVLAPAVLSCAGELVVDDLRDAILGGRMFAFYDGSFALVCHFEIHPRKVALAIDYGAGVVTARSDIAEVLTAFGKSGGADTVRTYCRNPAMTRYYRRWFGLKPIYTVLEKPL